MEQVSTSDNIRESKHIEGSVVKNLPVNAGDKSFILGWNDPLERKWQPTPVFLPGK